MRDQTLSWVEWMYANLPVNVLPEGIPQSDCSFIKDIRKLSIDHVIALYVMFVLVAKTLRRDMRTSSTKR